MSRANSTFTAFNRRRPEIASGLAEVSPVGASEAYSVGFTVSHPPELEILVGKDPNDMLSDYGYSDRWITELGFRPPVRRRGQPKASASSRKPKRTLPAGLERLSYEEVEQILDDDGYTKRQIAELGFRRFGIPEKSMLHSRKYEAVTSVRDAVANERILDVLYEQASKSVRTA